MSRSFPIIKIIAVVQIIALMICTTTFNTLASDVIDPPVDTTTAVTEPTEPVTPPTGPVQNVPTDDDDELSDEEIASVNALQEQRTQLLRQAKALQDARMYYSDSLDGLLQQKQNIEDQIALKQREIDINAQLKDRLTEQINATDEELIRREQSLLVRRQSILERFNSLRMKLRALSKSGNMTTLQMIASSDSFTSYLINSKMAARISSANQEAINSLEKELSDIESERMLLERQQEQLEEERKPFESATQSLESSKQELLALHAEAEAISEQLAYNITYYRQQYLQLSSQQSYLQQQITEIVKDFDPGNMVAADTMYWPSPECTIITSSYKSRWGRWHYGIDIASWGDSTGKSIVAAADGVVIFSASDSSGYGNYIMIDHGLDIAGQRIITMYAHCDALYVTVGDVVFGGQTIIGAVGNTGNSTGPHLHFEVRVNGNAVDPIGEGYLLTNGITITD